MASTSTFLILILIKAHDEHYFIFIHVLICILHIMIMSETYADISSEWEISLWLCTRLLSSLLWFDFSDLLWSKTSDDKD